MKNFEKLTIYCYCESPEHQFTLVRDPEDGDLWLQVHLSQSASFFKRLWTGLKYAFGYKSKYGDWDHTVITTEDQRKIVEFLNRSVKQMPRKSDEEYGC